MSRASAEVGSAANSYEILAKLAMGGMAEIFLARGASSAGVERYVVLKRILRDRKSDQAFIRMFLDEARLAAQLQHPNIAQVYDIGKLGDSYFFTMEYVHGETVRTLLQRSHALRRPIPIGSTLTVIAGAAAGLHHAHERKGMDGKPLGIVHRDVSPSNLMVSYEGTVKVVDFGVAKAAHRDTETRSGTVKGKITYMSPEQCRGGDIDRRSDLFSLGIVMWEMLTTERLFRRNSDFENMQAIVAEDVPPPSSLRHEIPPDIDRIVMKLLAKNASDRYQTADEVHEDIENAAVRTGSALSAASLGRFMRELFGQRPEPWIELQSNESHPEAYTVTSEPIAPAELREVPDELDVKLAAIPHLSARMTAQQETPPHIPVERPLVQPTVPLRVQAEDLKVTHRQTPAALAYARGSTPAVGVPGPSHPTLPMPAAPVPPSAPHAAMQSFTPSQSAQHGLHQSGPVRAHTPSLTPQSSPQLSPYPMVQSGSHSMASYGSLSHATPKPRSRAVIILIPAVVVGVIIGIALAVGDDDTKKPAESANTVALTPDENKAAAPVAAPDPAPVDTTPVEAPEANPPEPKLAEAKPADATVTQPTPADATPVEDAKPADATPVDDVTPATKTVVDKKRPAKQDIAALFRASKYSDVVEQCASSSRIVALNATTCTLAACKLKEKSSAKRWLASVAAAKRSSVIRDCGGVLPAERPAGGGADACKRDPLACQH